MKKLEKKAEAFAWHVRGYIFGALVVGGAVDVGMPWHIASVITALVLTLFWIWIDEETTDQGERGE